MIKRDDGSCVVCHGDFGDRSDRKCAECGTHIDRVAKKRTRGRKIGGKRGRNSGKVHTAKHK